MRNRNLERGALHSRTLELVRTAPRQVQYSDMAKECGTSVAWVSRFANDKIANPSVNIVERLHNYLVGVQNAA